MTQIKRQIEQFVTGLLRQCGVPDNQLHSLVKKTGRGMILLSVLMVVPLLVFSGVPNYLKITLQMSYAILLCLGVILAFDENPKKGK